MHYGFFPDGDDLSKDVCKLLTVSS